MTDSEPTAEEVEADLRKLKDWEFLELNLVNLREQALSDPCLVPIVRRFERLRDRLLQLDHPSR